MDGETFHPRPSSRAGIARVPSVAMPPRPGSPVWFSALIDRVWAADMRDNVPSPMPSPLNSPIVDSALRLFRTQAVGGLDVVDRGHGVSVN
jgi:hypothetical protein